MYQLHATILNSSKENSRFYPHFLSSSMVPCAQTYLSASFFNLCHSQPVQALFGLGLKLNRTKSRLQVLAIGRKTKYSHGLYMEFVLWRHRLSLKHKVIIFSLGDTPIDIKYIHRLENERRTERALTSESSERERIKFPLCLNRKKNSILFRLLDFHWMKFCVLWKVCVGFFLPMLAQKTKELINISLSTQVRPQNVRK